MKSKLNFEECNGRVWHWYLNLKQKINLKEIKMDKLSVKKVKSEVENEEIKLDELSVIVKFEN